MISPSGFGTKKECFRSNQSITISLEAVGFTQEKSFGKLKFLKNQNILMASLQNTILTKDNLIRCNWSGHDFCAFCREKETI
jgi:uncharacterized protein YjbI with pentapeptide repeats